MRSARSSILGGEAWICEHWMDPSQKARQNLLRNFGNLAAWFFSGSLRFVCS
ncbi:MAG: hypothetical protein JW999_09105 [Methanotrichaceae archaeon]|nr:hypothetical protein [Methanotrichaceae archaeon]